MDIKQLQAMPIGSRTGGGFVLTVKKTKKSVQLPNKKYIHTVVLFDNTGEMLADFKDPGTYNPLIKGQQVAIVVAEIQQAEGEGKKLFVDQFDIPAGKSEPDYFGGFDDIPDWETITRGKIRHGLVCSYIRAGKTIGNMDKEVIETLVEYIMKGK